MQVFGRDEEAKVQTLVRDYVCAQCWGDLRVRSRWAEGKGVWFEVACAHNPEHEGFVRRAWVEWQRFWDKKDARDALVNLSGVMQIDDLEDCKEQDPFEALGF